MPLPDRRSLLGPVLCGFCAAVLLYAAMGAPGLQALMPAGINAAAARTGMVAVAAVVALLAAGPTRTWWQARQQRTPLSAAWANRIGGLAVAVFVLGIATCLAAGVIGPWAQPGPGALSGRSLGLLAWSGLATALAAPLAWRTLYRWARRDGASPSHTAMFRARPVQVALLFVLAAAYFLTAGRALIAVTAAGPRLLHLAAGALAFAALAIAVVTFTTTVRWLLRRLAQPAASARTPL